MTLYIFSTYLYKVYITKIIKIVTIVVIVGSNGK